MNEFIKIAEPSLGDEESRAIASVIDSGWLTQGPKVAEFENLFAAMHKVKFCLATTSCTSALHVMLQSAGIGPGDEVLVPSFTWIATANAVLYTGAKPIFVDIDLDTYNVNFDSIVEKLNNKTKAIIVVHLFGLCVDIPALRKKIPGDILIFEDAACAAGSKIHEVYAGGLGDAAAFSFHPRKSITTGEGGMFATNNAEMFTMGAKVRNHGADISAEKRHASSEPFNLPDFKILGQNYRMTDLQAAIGVIQLLKLEKFIEQRSIFAQYYSENLADIENVMLPHEPLGYRHAWQSYVIRISGAQAGKRRNQIMMELQNNGIGTRPGTHAIHTLTYYRERYSIGVNDFPNSYLSQETTIALPMHNKLSESAIHKVVKVLKGIL
jgi:perosamine synthetase